MRATHEVWAAIALAIVTVTGPAASAAAVHYTNPVVLPVAADPSVIRAADGVFYLYATQDNWGDGRPDHLLPIFRSRDLVRWEHIGDVFAHAPLWKEGAGFVWAPDVSWWDGEYRLYYAYSAWGDPNPCIGLAKALHPEGPWTDLGRPVFCSRDVGVANSIDPFAWQEGSHRFLFWGSFHGIYGAPLSEDGTSLAGQPVMVADRRFEGAYVYHRDGFYYLFVSAGSCCEGDRSTYTLWAGRARDVMGPYLDADEWDLRRGGGTLVLYRNDHWIGPGHNSIVTDDAGNAWLIYHAIPATDPWLPNGASRRPALIDRIEWVDGWPVVNGGEGPSWGPMPAPAMDESR